MKPTMILNIRISVDSSQSQRYTEKEIMKEFDDDNILIERKLIIRKTDGAVMGGILNKEKNMKQKVYYIVETNKTNKPFKTFFSEAIYMEDDKDSVLNVIASGGSFKDVGAAQSFIMKNTSEDDEVFLTPIKANLTGISWLSELKK